jgi:hypothetical protein
VAEPVALPAMGEAQKQSWHALMDLYERLDSDWTLIGGQLVHLHCAERGATSVRPTNDADTVLDIRTVPQMHETFTAVLRDLGFSPEISGEGIQHRWRKGLAQVDVLIPEGVGQRAARRPGAGGAPTVSAPGTTQALERSDPVTVLVSGRVGTVLRPRLVAALIGKAAARTEISSDRKAERHCVDFVILAGLISAVDFRDVTLTKKDRDRLRRMIPYCLRSDEAMSVEYADEALDRLERAAGLND